MLVPVEGVAGESGGVAGVAVTDREVQRHHGVAAAGVREGVRQRFGGLGDTGVLVPVEGVAGESDGVAGVAVTDGQVQGHYGVAAGSVREGVRQCFGGLDDAGVLVPVEGVAGESGGVAGIAVVDGQMQGDGAVTAVLILEYLNVFTGNRIDGVVPSVAVASGFGDGRHIFRIDAQVQGDDAVASVNGRERVHVGAFLGEGGAVEVVASVEADGLVELCCEVRPHGQRHRGHAVAVIDVFVVVHERVGARLGEGRVEAVGMVAGAGADLVGQCYRVGRVHRDMQHDGTVAAVDGGDDARVGGVADLRGRHVETVQPVGLAFAERGVKVGGVQLVYDEVQHRDRRTAVRVGVLVLMVSRGCRTVDIEAVLRVVATVTDVRFDGVACLFADGQRERHNTVATVNRL